MSVPCYLQEIGSRTPTGSQPRIENTGLDPRLVEAANAKHGDTEDCIIIEKNPRIGGPA